MHSRHCESGRQGGAALVAALLIFALCTSLIVAMKGEFLRFYQRGANLFYGEQGLAYLRGAEELARRALLVDEELDRRRGQQRDDLNEVWAQTPVPYELDEGGWLMGSLTDLQGRFNLNSLLSNTQSQSVGGMPGEKESPARSQFIRLLQTLEEVPITRQQAVLITDSLIDWLDRDGNARARGAEDEYYSDLSPAYRAANRPMASVSELMAVAFMTPEIYRALRGLVTVWPAIAAPVNIHTAPLEVLRSLNDDGNLKPLTLGEAESLLSVRESAGFENVESFLAHPVFAPKEGKLKDVTALVGETSSYFLLQAEAEVAERKMRLYSVLKREDGKVAALVRATGSL
jgi:general secretion pathway protein K